MSRATKRARSEDAEDSKCEIWIEAKDPREVRKEKKAIRGGDYNTISEKLRHELGLISGPLPESEKANILKAFPKATGKVRLGYSFSKEDEGSRRVTFVVLEEPSHELMLSAANYDAVVSERDSGASCYTVYGKKQKTEEKKQTDLDKSEADKENKDMIDKARREAKEKDDKKRGIEAEGSAKKSGTK